MVVKSFTKYWLEALGIPMVVAGWIADDRFYRGEVFTDEVGNIKYKGLVYDGPRRGMKYHTPVLNLSYRQWNEILDSKGLAAYLDVWGEVPAKIDPAIKWLGDMKRRDEVFMEMNDDRIREGLAPIIISGGFINWRNDPFEVKT